MKQISKSKRLVGLFAATALVAISTPGCEDDIDLCYDHDLDNHCDDDYSTYDPNDYIVVDGKKVAYIKEDSYVSSGSSS